MRCASLLSAVAALCALAGTIGCSHVAVRQVTAEHPYAGGVRFYRPWPYLLVTTDRSETVQAQILYLPDLSQEYTVEPRVRLGSVEMDASFADGWQLTKLGAAADPQIAKTLEAVAGLVSAGGGVAVAPQGEGPAFPLAPGLYRLVYSGAHVAGVERVPLEAP